MKKEKESHRLTIYEGGPYSLDEFNKIVKGYFNKNKKEWNGPKLTRFELEFVQGYNGYCDNEPAHLDMVIYRTETNEEEKAREEQEKKDKLALEARKRAARKAAMTKKAKQEALLKDPDYKKFIELEKKFKKK